MSDFLNVFERIARRAAQLNLGRPEREEQVHPFDVRNIHPEITEVSLKLFDNGHYSQATFEAFKYLDKQVSSISGISESGWKLMMAAFNENLPKIKLTEISNPSEIDEQLGYKHIFAGAMSAIRNPRGHDIKTDPIERCLDHLSFASVLLRRLEERV